METHSFYRQEELAAAQADCRRSGRAMAVAGGLGLALCILICCFATRHNRGVTFPLTVAASVLSGWIVIFLSHSRHAPAKARVRHVELMLTGPRERFAGRFEKLEGTYRVKGGVSIRKVRLREEFHETMLTVYAEKAPLLPEAFEGAAETVDDCIVAFEEADPADVAAASREVSP